jgi:predicted lipoprotein with Yx(FWY)xxD motif
LSALGGIALVAAACGSTASTSTTTTAAPGAGSSTPTSSSSATDMVLVKSASVGGSTALVNTKGFTLYEYALDKPGKIACLASCIATWPPLLLPSGDQLSMSMHGLGTEARPGGGEQVTYNGSPLYTFSLYTFSGDSAPGQDNGVGIPHWSVARTSSASGSSTTTSTSSSGGGYGY